MSVLDASMLAAFFVLFGIVLLVFTDGTDGDLPPVPEHYDW